MEEPTKAQAKRPAKAPARKASQAPAKPAAGATPGEEPAAAETAPRTEMPTAEKAPPTGGSPAGTSQARPVRAAKKTQPNRDAGRQGEPETTAKESSPGKPKKTSAATTTARRDATTAVPSPTSPAATSSPKPARKRTAAGQPASADGEPNPAPTPKPTPKGPPRGGKSKDLGEPTPSPRPRPAPPANRPQLRVLEQLEIPLPHGALTVNGTGPTAMPTEPPPTADHDNAEHSTAEHGTAERSNADGGESPAPATTPRPPVRPLTEAEIQAWLPPADPASSRRSRWGGVLGEHLDAEQAARVAVRELGPVAAARVARLRARYPQADPTGLARLAAHELVREARRVGADPVAAMRGLLIPREQALLVLTVAAAHGVDPVSPLRVPELLELLRVPRLTPTRRDLTNLARSLSTIAVRAVAARLVPFGGPAAGAVQGGRSATDLTHRALRYYTPR